MGIESKRGILVKRRLVVLRINRVSSRLSPSSISRFSVQYSLINPWRVIVPEST